MWVLASLSEVRDAVLCYVALFGWNAIRENFRRKDATFFYNAKKNRVFLFYVFFGINK
jgi:hypothetical protein